MPRLCHEIRVPACVVAPLLMLACSNSAPSPPVVTPPSNGETINGTERLGWSQRAADAVELATVRYAIYVDGTRSELAATCDTTAAADGFPCSAKLPPLPAGSHTLELASFVIDGSLLESSRSPALRVTVTGVTTDSTRSRPADREPMWPDKLIVSVGDATLRIERLADGLDQPTDLALAPDGRVFVAEARGTVRTIVDGRLSPPASVVGDRSSGSLAALALDPDFERTRFVFAILAEEGAFSIVRLREVSSTLGDRVVLLGGLNASGSNQAASLRFGPDGKLYAAFDDGGDARRAVAPSSWNGKILRLNRDGTTPPDQAGGSPVFAAAATVPAGFDWQPNADVLWIADRATGALVPIVTAASGAEPRVRGLVQTAWALPAGSPPSAIAFVRGTRFPSLAGNLLVASKEGRQLLRLRFDPLDRSRIASADPLLQDVVGPIRAVACGPDAIYFATPQSVGRLVPE